MEQQINRPHKVVNGVKIDLTDEEIIALEAQRKEWQEAQAKIQYIEDRQLAYPSIPDQFDIIYHKGLDEWKLAIKAIKDAYPKPQL